MRMNEVSDKQAERGISITNVLLSILIALGSIFGNVVLGSMDKLQTSVSSVETSITTIQVTNGIALNDIKHLQEAEKVTATALEEIRSRLRYLEKVNNAL